MTEKIVYRDVKPQSKQKQKTLNIGNVACVTALSIVLFSLQGVLLYTALKTHFGLHNPLMTRSSLEIRNCLCLMPVLQVGACNGGD